MLSYFTSSHFSSITHGNGSTIPIYYVGHTQLPSPTTPLLLRDVLIAPAHQFFISVYKFTYCILVSFEFDPFGLYVKDYLAKVEITRFNSSMISILSLELLPPLHHPSCWPLLTFGTIISAMQVIIFCRHFLVNFLSLVILIIMIVQFVNRVKQENYVH